MQISPYLAEVYLRLVRLNLINMFRAKLVIIPSRPCILVGVMISTVCAFVSQRQVFNAKFSRGMSTAFFKAEICSGFLEHALDQCSG